MRRARHPRPRDGRRHLVAAPAPRPRDACSPSAAERDRLQGELREHGSSALLRQRRRQPAASRRRERASRRRTPLRGAVELAALLGVETVVTMSGCPGGRGDGDSTGVFAVCWICCDDEPLWEWQFRERVVPFWRDLSTLGRVRGARRAHLPRAAPRRRRSSATRASAACAPRSARTSASTSTRATSGGRASIPLAVVEEHGDAIGFAHGKDTLLHPDRIRAHGVLDARYPVDPEHGALALRRRRRRPPRATSGARCSPRCARAATTAWSRSSTRTRG